MLSEKKLNKWIKEHDIAEIECLVPDLAGNARGKFIPTKKFFSEKSRMPEGLLIQSVTGEFPNRYWDIIDTIDGDMLLEPDFATGRPVPWANQSSVQIIHDCYTKKGEPHPFSSRTVLKRILGLFNAQGLQPVVAPEMEFYLVKCNPNPREVLEPPVGRSGRPETARQSYSIDATNEFKPFIETLYQYSKAINLDIDILIHESGAAQFEINFVHGEALALADQIFMFKRLVREAALKHDMYATFMAKPITEEPGSAKHIHQSLLSKKTGKNIFASTNGKYSDDFFHYIGGLQKFSPALMSIFAPNVNSYRRLSGADSAPINFQWGYDNRSTGFRIPDASPENYRIENRCPGADVNPYLSFAATLACGYLGIQQKIKPTEAFEGNAYKGEIDLPRSLPEALRALQQSKEVNEIFGPKFVEAYIAVKSLEFEQFNQIVSSWEREHLLLRV